MSTNPMPFPDLLHLILAISTVFIVCAAGAQAIIVALQERVLRQHRLTSVFSRLPPLETNERILFYLVALGFFLLSILLVTSLYFFHQLLWQQWPLQQKTLLVLLAWLIFAGLLLGRFLWGWRGRKAIYGTLYGVLLLLAVYLGSRLLIGWH